MTSLEELIDARNKARKNADAYQNQIAQLENQYNKLVEARDIIQAVESEFFSKYQYESVYTKNIGPDDWTGQMRITYEYDIDAIYQVDMAPFIKSICMDIESIEEKINQLSIEAENIRSQQQYWNNQIDRYDRRIRRRS